MFENEAARQLAHTYYGLVVSRCIHELADIGAADALDETPESSDVLAQRIGAHPDALRRILRLLATQGIFREDSSGKFAHTDQSRLLRSDHPQSMRALLSAGLSWTIFSELRTALSTGRPAMTVVAPDGFFAFLTTHPEEARRFDEAMTAKANIDIGSLMLAYDFSKFGLIADIGGGRGHLIKIVLASSPSSKGVLFDLPHVVAKALVQSSERLSIQGGDLFRDALPTADAYVLMNVIHDWDDPEATKILNGVRRAAPELSKLLVIEAILPERAEPGPTGYNRAMLTDVAMLAFSGGRERTLSKYQALLGQTGFDVDRVIPTSGDLSVIECSPRV
jgi:hypothetical protein